MGTNKKYRSWTTEEINIIGSGDYTMQELAEIFEVTKTSIMGVVDRYKLKTKNVCRRWTKEELEFIDKNSKDMSNGELAKKLGVTPAQISNIKHYKNIGVKKKKAVNPADVEFIRNNLHLSDTQIGIRIEKKSQTVYLTRKKFNIKREVV